MRKTDGVLTTILVPLACCVPLAGLFAAAATLLPAPRLPVEAPAELLAVLEAPDPAPARESLRARSKEPPRAAADTVEPTTLPLLLRGTLASKKDEHSLAMVENPSDGRIRSLRVGDVWADAEVASIHRGRVLFRRGERLEELLMGARVPRPTAARPAQASPPRASREEPRIRPEGPGQFRVSRHELERAAGQDAPLHANDIRILPAFEGGVATGFKLAFVRGGSLFEKLGLKQGDVLNRVNGLSLDSPEKALQAYGQLKQAARIDLEVQRGGARTALTYLVDGT